MDKRWKYFVGIAALATVVGSLTGADLKEHVQKKQTAEEWKEESPEERRRQLLKVRNQLARDRGLLQQKLNRVRSTTEGNRK